MYMCVLLADERLHVKTLLLLYSRQLNPWKLLFKALDWPGRSSSGVRGQLSAQYQVLAHNRQLVLTSCLPQTTELLVSKYQSSQTF